MNQDPDYSAAYVVRKTDRAGGPRPHVYRGARQRGACGHRRAGAARAGWTSSRSRRHGRLLAPRRRDSQLRWLGPEKGVIHMATAAVVNAVWDLYAKREGKPLWRLLADMTPGADRRPRRLPLPHRRPHAGGGAGDLRQNEAEKKRSESGDALEGVPAYTTSPGWLGYPDEKMRRLIREALVGRLQAHQDQGRRRRRGRCRCAACPGGDGPRRR